MRYVSMLLAVLLAVMALENFSARQPTEMWWDPAAGVDPEKMFSPEEVRRLRALGHLPPSGLYYGYRGDEEVDPELRSLRPATAGAASGAAPTTRNVRCDASTPPAREVRTRDDGARGGNDPG